MVKPVLTALCVTAVLAASSPGLAAEALPTMTYTLPNPWHAEAMAAPLNREPAERPTIAPLGAAICTVMPTLLLNAGTVGSFVTPSLGNFVYWTGASMAISPLSLGLGYGLAGEPERGTSTVLWGYAAEAVGALACGIGYSALQSTGEGGGYGFLAGLLVGPLVANTLYSLWAASDVYRLTEANRKR